MIGNRIYKWNIDNEFQICNSYEPDEPNTNNSQLCRPTLCK